MLLAMLAFGEGPAVAVENLWAEIPFEPPATVPLYLKAEVRTIKGVQKGGGCDAAADLALEEARGFGTVLRVVVSKEDLSPARKVPCKQRRAGDEITASVVTLNTLVVAPGAPPSVYPELTTERALQVAALLSVMASPGRIAPIDDIGGKAWVRLEGREHEQVLDVVRYDPRERGQRVFEAVVRPWVVQWVNVVQGLPEVHGAVVDVDVPVEDPSRGRRGRKWTERFRFAIPTDVAVRFDRGDLMSEEVAGLTRVDWVADVRKPEHQPLALGANAEGGIPTARTSSRARALPSADDDIPEEIEPAP